jgi:hypothetical protein
MPLATEATRYLEAIDFFRSLELAVDWRSEADEVGAFSPMQRCGDLPRASTAPAHSFGSTGNTSASEDERERGSTRCHR